ncbi:MAG TPA: hypothetical protein VIV65_07545 [Gemmatimonadaceae bacterium]
MGRWWRPILLLLVATSSSRAQKGSPQLTLSVPPGMAAKSDLPTVAFANMLTEGHLRDLLTAGWPMVLHCRLDLWKKGFIAYSQESAIEWDYIVEYSTSAQTYTVKMQQGNRLDVLGVVKNISDAEQLVDRPIKPAISPQESGGRYYYDLSVDLSALRMSDLDAWQRWVRGEAQPAVKGRRSVFSAFKEGVGSLMSRVLGGDRQHYDRRSETFTAG